MKSDRYSDWPRISDMTPEERLTAAAIIMRDGIEKSLSDKAPSCVSSPDAST